MRWGWASGRDLAEAARWYKLAADTGDRQAIFALGIAKLKGRGRPEKIAPERRRYLKRAAAQNHPGALYNLGILAIEIMA